MAMKQSTKDIIKFLQAHYGEKMTAEDIANAMGLDKRKVDGAFTMALQKHGLGYRQEAERQNPDSTHTKIKYLILTDEGRRLDVDAESGAE